MATLHNPKKEAYIMTIQEKLDDEAQLQIMNLVAEVSYGLCEVRPDSR
jgi:hypothetical protein